MSNAIADNDYPLELAGETWRLEFTPRAHALIAKAFGGFRHAHAKLDQDRDPDAMALIIRHGSACGDKEAKRIPKTIFTHGSALLVQPLRMYLYRLEAGGRTMEEIATAMREQAEGDDGEGES